MDQRLESAAPFAAACLPALLVALPTDRRFIPLAAVVVALAFWLAWHSPFVERSLADRPGLRWSLMFIAAAAVAWLLFGASPRATWGVIDDHEIHAMIGPGRERIPLAELPSRIASHPEIADPSFTSTRYRPMYYLLRLVEAAVWGKAVTGWMITRLVLFTFTATLGFDLLRQWLGFVSGGIALAVFATLWMWPEIVIQLGPPECYAAPAVAAFAWCAVAILRSTTPAGTSPWAGLALAALVAIGSKENFVILAPLAVVVAGCEWWRGRLTAAGITATTVVVAAAAWVAFVVGVGIGANGGRDVYQRPVGLAGFARSGEGSSGRLLRKLAGYGLPLVGAACGLAVVAWRTRLARPRQAVACAVGATLALVALSQFFFYRGEVFKKCRYDLPFVPIVMVLLIGGVAAAASSRHGGPAARRARRRLLVPGTLAVVAYALGGGHSRAATEQNVARTTTFHARLQAIAAACRADPGRPVVFTVGAPPTTNYEPVISTASYLRSSGIVNPLFLEPSSVAVTSRPEIATWQERDLAMAARDGGHRFAAWADLPKAPPPIVVHVSTTRSRDHVSPSTFLVP